MHATPGETALPQKKAPVRCTAKKINNRLLLYSCVNFNIHFS
jgi:hypothetical protein